MDNIFLEKLMVKALLEDINYLTTLALTFDKEYFDNEIISNMFEKMKVYVKEYNNIPPISLIENDIPGSAELLEEINSIDFNLSDHKAYLFDETNKYLKDKSLKKAILDSADIINSGEDKLRIRRLIEDALTKDLMPNIGTKYFETLSERLKKEFDAKTKRIPTGFPQLDEYINGGFPPFTLSVFIARIHEWKCLSGDTFIKLKRGGKIYYDKIENLFINTSRDEYEEEVYMPSLEVFQNKYGEEEGKQKHGEWRNRLKGSRGQNNTKGLFKLELFRRKYGDKEGQKRYNIWIEKNKGAVKGAGTLRWYVDKYGEDEGQKRYRLKCLRLKEACSNINTLEWYVEKYGEVEGKQRYKKKNMRISDPGRGTENYFVHRYGKDEGEKRYKIYINRLKESNTIEGYTKRYGKSEGKRKFEERLEFLRSNTSLKGFISRYGDVEGRKRWKERQRRWLKSYKKSNFSRVSQELFWKIYNIIKGDFKTIRFAQLQEDGSADFSGKNNECHIDIGKSFVRPDFFVGDIGKIIEFDGDYWHGEGRGNKISDRIRDEKIREAGYDVIHIRERDYKNDPGESIRKCLEFIKE